MDEQPPDDLSMICVPCAKELMAPTKESSDSDKDTQEKRAR